MAQTQVPESLNKNPNHESYNGSLPLVSNDKCKKLLSRSSISIYCITDTTNYEIVSQETKCSISHLTVSTPHINEKKLISLQYGRFYEKFRGFDNPKQLFSGSITAPSFTSGFGGTSFSSFGGFGGTSSSGGFSGTSFSCSGGGFGEYGMRGGSQFYLTFNTFDGRKRINSVDDAKEIESIVLEYRIDSGIDSELNRKIQLRKKEIDTLKAERIALCELIDRTYIANDLICDGLRGKYPRFFEIKTIKEMNNEFEFINEQIRIGSQEIAQYEQLIEETKNNNYEDMCVTIPYGKMVNIKIVDHMFGLGPHVVYYDCYWRHSDTDDHEMNHKKSDSFMEINDVDITKKYIQSVSHNPLQGST